MTKRELDNASTSSLAQALEVEALAQSVNVHTDDLREALDGVRGTPPAELHGPVARCRWRRAIRNSDDWDEVLERSRSSAATRRGRWAATSG